MATGEHDGRLTAAPDTTAAEELPDAMLVTTYFHCGSPMRVHTSSIEEVDGQTYRKRYHVCLVCDRRASSSDPFPGDSQI